MYGGILEDLWPSLFGKQHQRNHANIEKSRCKENETIIISHNEACTVPRRAQSMQTDNTIDIASNIGNR